MILVKGEDALVTFGGEIDRAGEVAPELGAEPPGGLDGTSAHAAAASGKKPPVLDHEFLPEGRPSLLSSSGVEAVSGLGEDEGAFAITERGGRIVKIWSSAGGGP